MNIQAPPSPASTASNDWPGPRKYRYPNPPTFAQDQGRRNLATPPTSGSSFGTTGAMANGYNGRLGDYRRPNSPPNSITARSSNRSGRNEAEQRPDRETMEESLHKHYTVVKKYLRKTRRDEAAEGKPNRARDKLIKLSPIQFQELSTDVYDELERRDKKSEVLAFLEPDGQYHPKRNQARQKLSTLPSARFRALATDVFYELERRVPRFASGGTGRGSSPANSMRGPPSRSQTPNGMARPGSRDQLRRPYIRNGSMSGQMNGGSFGPDGMNGPMQKSSQSNTIVPNKSYLVEDDDDADGDSLYGASKRSTNNTNRSFGANGKLVSEYQDKLEELQGKIDNLEKEVEAKNATIQTLERSHQSREREASEADEGFSTLREELEAKLAEALALNDGLQTEIDKAKDMHEEREKDLQDKLNVMATRSSEDDEWKEKHNYLQEENERLQLENQELQQDSQEIQQELLEQQRVTDEVRKEAAGFLTEMKALSLQGSGSQGREEQLKKQVRSLEDQVVMWKTRLAESKAGTRSAALSLVVPQPSVDKDSSLLQPNGLIMDVHVIEFQIAIDECIRISRQDPKSLLGQMKSVILAVKNITDDFDRADDGNPKIAQLVTKVSGTACNFITATKNFVFSSGLSPISLLDAASSHLSAAIVEAVYQVKMYPSDNAADGYLEPVGKSGRYLATNGRSSMTDSVYSSASAPRASEYTDIIDNRKTLTNGAGANGVKINGTQGSSASDQPTLGEIDDLKNLKMLLEDQNASISEEIQSLVFSIRTSTEPPVVRASIFNIASSVEAVSQAINAVVRTLPVGRDALGTAVQSLASSKAGLLKKENRGWGQKETQWKENANGLPPIAFEIARQMRELAVKVEKLASGSFVASTDTDDFS